MTEKQILKSIKALAAGECANYHGGFCAETDRRCHLINPKYDSIRDGMIDCDYGFYCKEKEPIFRRLYLQRR